MSSRGSRRGGKSAIFDYGDLLGSDEEEGGKQESVSDLLGQSKKDPAMVLGGSGRARSSVQLGGGLDPLESLLKKEQKEQQEDEENAEEFDREFRKLAGMSLGENVLAATAPAEVGREEASSSRREDRPKADFDDLVGEILGEPSEPVRSRPGLRRSQTAPLDEGARREESQRLGRAGSGMPEVSPGGSEAAFSESRVDLGGEGRVPEGALEVELIQRPKRSLGRAKASPASSRVMTPGLDPEEPAGSSTPLRPPKDPAELAQPQPRSEPRSRLAPPKPTSGSSKSQEALPPRPESQAPRPAVASIAALVAEQEARRLPTDGENTPPSQRELSFALEAGAAQGFSGIPPTANAPDLLLQVAHWKAKAKHLELQMEDLEQRWQRRFEDAKRQEDAGHARLELQCRYLESELEKSKELRASDERDFGEQKRRLAQGHRTEQEEAVREERRKVQMEMEKVKSDHRMELEELKRQHDRALAIVRQQADAEADNLRRAQSGEQHLTRLVEQVQGSVAEVERLSKRVDSDKTLEWTVRERQIEARERNAKEMEAQLAQQSRDVEEQRRRLSDLVTSLQSCQEEDGTVLAGERERLQAEHQRLLELQQSVREADRNNKEALKHAWAQVEEERRVLQQEQLRFDGEQVGRKEDLDSQERQLKSETERLKTLHQQIEVARQGAARRLRETEATVAAERRCLMNDLEAFEEKRRSHGSEALKLENERRQLQEEKTNFESELHSVGLMAQELERRSEEIKALHQEAAEARTELHALRGQLQEERSAQSSEMERLRTMQALIEQQRLQLLQTENQLRLQGVEDIEPVATGAHFEWPVANAQEAMSRWSPEWLEKTRPEPPAVSRPASLNRSGGDFQTRSKLQRSRKGSGEMQSYLLQSAAFLQEAKRSTLALPAMAKGLPSGTSSDLLEAGSSQSSSGEI